MTVAIDPQNAPHANDWRRSYARILAFSDVFVVVWAVFGAQLIWFGIDSANVATNRQLEFTVNYTLVSVVLGVLWLAALQIAATREYRIVGAGPEEYKRVVNVSMQLFGLVAIIGFAFQIDFSRGYLLVALPAGLIGLLLERWLWRQWLKGVRQSGQFSAVCVVVGSSRGIDELLATLNRTPSSGYRVVAVCSSTPSRELKNADPSIGVHGVDELYEVMQHQGIDTVIMTGGHGMSARETRELSWALSPGDQHLVMVPTLIDIAGPRIHTRPVAGLPLIHVETPRYQRAGRFTKRAFDIVGALVVIILLLPVLIAAALAVKLTSPGPVLFKQERVGLNGSTFKMLKFRSMVVDAEERLAELLKAQRDAGNEVLFKMRDDPRVTPIGRFMRRFSIDELPQLFNVLGGSMSLVGPRPPLVREVSQYDDAARRRLLVRPGLTGLWQVSGRSSLSWEESIRLDLYYVENWSLMGDFVLIWRTVKAVLARDGAY